MAKKSLAVLEVTVFIGLLMVFAHWSTPLIAARFGVALANLCLAALWIVPPVLYVLLAKKDRSAYGFDFRNSWRQSVHYGFWGLLVARVQAPGFVAWGLLGTPGIFVLYGLVVLSILLLLWTMRSDSPRPRIDWKIAAFVVLLILPSIVASLSRRMSLRILGWQVFYLFAVGLGEEIRSRGYVQSRLNEAFGRPWMIWGTQFGPGLLIASVLFGLPHIYQIGAAAPNVLIGIGAALGGLFYGIVRERAGSVLASALVHGLNTAAFEIYRHIFSLSPS